jgi:osmotically-inducible protein OsmY
VKTDVQLKQDVIAELIWEPSVNAAAIGVEVKDGVVTLAGHVQSFSEKWDAERAAQRVDGVKALAIEMDVKLAGSYARNDTDIARAAGDALQWTVYWKHDSIKVMVEKGWITLTGEVEWDYQRRSAVWAVRNLIGVKGVNDHIKLKPAIVSTAIKYEIDDALKRKAYGDGKNISVSVKGDVVTLSGSAHSWAERELVLHSAWGTSGVRDVINNISISFLS